MTTFGSPSSEVELPKLPIGWHLLKAAVLLDGSLALVGTDRDLLSRPRFNEHGVPVADFWTWAAEAEARLWRFDGTTMFDGPQCPLETLSPEVDRFADDSWLVVAPRTFGPPNARVLSPRGDLICRFMLGDGVEQVAVDADDRIWVGWFDEGIAGNDRWKVPGEDWPPSSAGLGLFARDGKYLGLPSVPTSITDWGALNVGKTGTWICPEFDFPIVSLTHERVLGWWAMGGNAPCAMAVDGTKVLVAGGWCENLNRLQLFEIGASGNGEPAKLVATGSLPLRPRQHQPWDTPAVRECHVWEQPLLLAGRGDTISLVQDGSWLRWRVACADCQ